MEERKFLLVMRLIGLVLFGLAGYLGSRAMELGGVMLWIAVVFVFIAGSIIYAVGNGVIE